MTSLSSRPLPLRLHLGCCVFSRRLTRANAVSTRAPACPSTPTASHISRMKTFTTILARAISSTSSLPSRAGTKAPRVTLSPSFLFFFSLSFLFYPCHATLASSVPSISRFRERRIFPEWVYSLFHKVQPRCRLFY